MIMLKEMLEKRKVPPLMDREQMLEILLREEYGYLPPAPEQMSWTVTENYLPDVAGKANISKVMLTCRVRGKDFSFPIYTAIPKGDGPYPFFIHVNFRDDVPDRYMPTEELIDNGFACISFSYNDVSTDDGDFTNGLAGVLYENGQRGPTDPGKIAMWAWAVHRAMDYAQTLECLDMSRSVVCGHSRLGKTALLAGATDKRFAFVYSNDSGCSGAAITRDKDGETVRDICESRFPYWFCENYRKYIDNEHNMPFDQHYLLAVIAPRYVCVGCAAEDTWADPDSEILCCAAAGEAYEAMGIPGFISEDRLPVTGDVFHEGSIGYHLRAGTHYFGREDWQKLIRFVNTHASQK